MLSSLTSLILQELEHAVDMNTKAGCLSSVQLSGNCSALNLKKKIFRAYLQDVKKEIKRNKAAAMQSRV